MNRQYRIAAAILTLATLARLVICARLPLIDDEAYYWTWSTRLAPGYFDHPPAIAWIIAAGTAIFGKTALGVRAGGVVLTWLGSLALLPLVESPMLLAAILSTMPLFALGGLLATPDVPLLAGWMLALAGLGQLARPAGSRGTGAAWPWILVAGVGGGLAALGKYTAWGFWPLAFAAALLSRQRHRVFGTVAAGALALSLTLPNLRWEADHDWVSVRFQLHHGLAATTPPGLAGALEFLGAQLGLASPVLLVAALIAASRRSNWTGPATTLATLTSLPVLGFFTFAASRSRPEANWAAPAFVGFALLLARPLDLAQPVDTGVPAVDPRPRLTRAAWVGVGIAASLSALVVVHAFHPFLVVPKDPVARLGQGAQMAESVQAWGVPVVWTTRYQEAAVIRWYDPTDTMQVTTVPNVDREDQFDLWRVEDAARAGAAGTQEEPQARVSGAGQPGLFVRPYRSGEGTVVDDVCQRGGPNVVTEHDESGGVTARWQIYEVRECGRHLSPPLLPLGGEGARVPPGG